MTRPLEDSNENMTNVNIPDTGHTWGSSEACSFVQVVSDDVFNPQPNNEEHDPLEQQHADDINDTNYDSSQLEDSNENMTNVTIPDTGHTWGSSEAGSFVQVGPDDVFNPQPNKAEHDPERSDDDDDDDLVDFWGGDEKDMLDPAARPEVDDSTTNVSANAQWWEELLRTTIHYMDQVWRQEISTREMIYYE